RGAKEVEGDKLERAFRQQPAAQAEILQTLGEAFFGIGEYKRAVSQLERARDLRLALFGPDHPDTFDTLATLGHAYHWSDRLPAAILVFGRLRDRQVAKLGPDHPDTLKTLGGLATAYRF